MALQYETVGWQDYNGGRHSGSPSNLDESYGQLVHVWDPNNPDFHDYFWAYVPEPFDDWDDWYELIEALLDQHGIA